MIINTIETILIFLIYFGIISENNQATITQKPMDDMKINRSFIKVPITKSRFETMDKGNR
jgi:hypothetical protein